MFNACSHQKARLTPLFQVDTSASLKYILHSPVLSHPVSDPSSPLNATGIQSQNEGLSRWWWCTWLSSRRSLFPCLQVQVNADVFKGANSSFPGGHFCLLEGYCPLHPVSDPSAPLNATGLQSKVVVYTFIP